MQKTKQIYCKEFQAMLDDLEDEDHSLELEETTTNHFGLCKKRRLNLNQVRGLEKSFEADNKLEPERKLKLSQQLDLQPRQVAIWFQNRRARSKTKQLEKDYDTLKANFDALKANYSNLEQQKSALTAKLEELKSKIQNGSKGCKEEESPDSEQRSTKTQSHDLVDHHAKYKQVMNLGSCAFLELNGNSSSSSSPDQFIPDSTTSTMLLQHQVCQPQAQMVKIEHNFIGAEDSYNYFPADQGPNFYWYSLEQ